MAHYTFFAEEVIKSFNSVVLDRDALKVAGQLPRTGIRDLWFYKVEIET